MCQSGHRTLCTLRWYHVPSMGLEPPPPLHVHNRVYVKRSHSVPIAKASNFVGCFLSHAFKMEACIASTIT